MTVRQAPVPVRATAPAPDRIQQAHGNFEQYESPVREEHDATQRRHPR